MPYVLLALALSALAAILSLGASFELLPPAPAPAALSPDSGNGPGVRLKFAGDVMLGRHVRKLYEERGENYPFAGIAEWLRDADFAVVNLEGPVLMDAPRTPIESLRFAFEPRTADMLRAAGVDAVSLANNHAYDQGAAAYADSRLILGRAGVETFGHPVTADESSVLRLETPGAPVVLLGFNATWPSFRKEDALALAERESANGLLAVFIHWGEEYEPQANPLQRELAREFVNRGADLVIGHHPHVVQDVERYGNRLIFYSLGNFIFDQYFSRETQEGLGVEVILRGGKMSVRLAPISLAASQPRLMEGEAGRIFLDALADRSEAELAEEIRAGLITAAGPAE